MKQISIILLFVVFIVSIQSCSDKKITKDVDRLVNILCSVQKLENEPEKYQGKVEGIRKELVAAAQEFKSNHQNISPQQRDELFETLRKKLTACGAEKQMERITSD